MGCFFPSNKPKKPLPAFKAPADRQRSVSAHSKRQHSSLGMSAGSHASSGSSGSTDTSYLQHPLPQCRHFTYPELQTATGNFDASNVVGEGGFGKVYRGRLPDGTWVAVKRLDRNGMQGDREFRVEVGVLARLKHRNLVQLVGICVEGDHRLGVFVYIDKGSLRAVLDAAGPGLSWGERLEVALGAARGLAFLHEVAQPCVVHRDFSSANVLIDAANQAHVGDFGLARSITPQERLQDREREWERERRERVRAERLADGVPDSPGSTAMPPVQADLLGTYGYTAPEFAITGVLDERSDTYAYGVVLLEVLTAAEVNDVRRSASGCTNLVQWMRPKLGNFRELRAALDAKMPERLEVPEAELMAVAEVTAACLTVDPNARPRMVEVVSLLDHLVTLRERRGSAASASASTASPPGGEPQRQQQRQRRRQPSVDLLSLDSPLQPHAALTAPDPFAASPAAPVPAPDPFAASRSVSPSLQALQPQPSTVSATASSNDALWFNNPLPPPPLQPQHHQQQQQVPLPLQQQHQQHYSAYPQQQVPPPPHGVTVTVQPSRAWQSGDAAVKAPPAAAAQPPAALHSKGRQALGMNAAEQYLLMHPTGVCLVCLAAPRDWQLVPCGHAAACKPCGRRLAQSKEACPVCQVAVTGLKRQAQLAAQAPNPQRAAFVSAFQSQVMLEDGG